MPYYDIRRPNAMRKVYGENAAVWEALEDFRVRALAGTKKRTFYFGTKNGTLFIQWDAFAGKEREKLYAVYTLDPVRIVGGLLCGVG